MSEEEKLLKEAKKLQWEDRLLHNNWNARNDANADIVPLCDSIADPKYPGIPELGLPRKFLLQLWQINALWCSCYGWNWRLWTLMHSCYEVAEESGEVSQSMSGPVLTRENYAPHEPQMERHPVDLTKWNEALDIITYGSPEQCIQGMKVVCHELNTLSNDPECSLEDDLIKDADRLVSCLTDKVAKSFDYSLTAASSRYCKYVLHTLMQTFQNKRLAHAVNVKTLDNLITELLIWLLDERIPNMEDGSLIQKATNVLMIKILDDAERTSSFVVLIGLLKPLDPSRWPSPQSNESFATRNSKFFELVVKCLIKLTKVLQNTIYEVDTDLILQSIHIYLQDLGIEEIRRRVGADDKPLRMVKAVLHELVKVCGTAIKGHLSMVPIDMEPKPIILDYIDLNLQTVAAARMLMPAGPYIPQMPN